MFVLDAQPGLTAVLCTLDIGVLCSIILGVSCSLVIAFTALIADVESEKSEDVPCCGGPQSSISRTDIWSPVNALSAGIAHEINNPLGIIGQEAQLLKYLLEREPFASIEASAGCLESIREIVRQVDRCKELVNKLLSLARESDPIILRTDLNTIVVEMANLAERQNLVDKDVKIVRSLRRELPLVHTDPPLVRQVILNLINNAIQAIEKKGTVAISTAPAGEWVEIAVTDDGCGIPQENISKIFTPFYSTKPHGTGTGLGLAICRGIVERLGGQLTVGSEVGKCTTFTVRLPVEGPARSR